MSASRPSPSPAPSSSPEPFDEDDEMICLKLLTYIKKARQRESHERQLELIEMINAAIRKLLKGQTAQKDYSCQLLLSTVATHLVSMCEQVCQHRPFHSDFLPDQPVTDNNPESFDSFTAEQHQAELHGTAWGVVNETATLVSSIADLIKRDPPTPGRQENLHVELDTRLQKALRILS